MDNGNHLFLNKSKLRQQILIQRQSLSRSQWQQKSRFISDRLRDLTLFTEAKTVLAYFNFRQEPDLSSWFTSSQRWGFPRCVDSTLSWHLWQPGETLTKGKYGIEEPLPTAPMITPQEVDLILVPTVACDRQGYRLGYGGGYYDRLLSSPEWLNIPTIGIVFDFAYVNQLPKDAWDIKLDYICTELQCDRIV